MKRKHGHEENATDRHERRDNTYESLLKQSLGNSGVTSIVIDYLTAPTFFAAVLVPNGHRSLEFQALTRQNIRPNEIYVYQFGKYALNVIEKDVTLRYSKDELKCLREICSVRDIQTLYRLLATDYKMDLTVSNSLHEYKYFGIFDLVVHKDWPPLFTISNLTSSLLSPTDKILMINNPAVLFCNRSRPSAQIPQQIPQSELSMMSRVRQEWDNDFLTRLELTLYFLNSSLQDIY